MPRSSNTTVHVEAPLHHANGDVGPGPATWRITWDHDGNLVEGSTSSGLHPNRRHADHNSRNRSGVELALARRVHELEQAASDRDRRLCTGEVVFGAYSNDGNYALWNGEEFYYGLNCINVSTPAAHQLLDAFTAARTQVRQLRQRVAELEGEVTRRVPPRPVPVEDLLEWERELLSGLTPPAIDDSPEFAVGEAVETRERLDSLPVGTTIQYNTYGSEQAVAVYPAGSWYRRTEDGWRHGTQRRAIAPGAHLRHYYIAELPTATPSFTVGMTVTEEMLDTLPVGTMIHFSRESHPPQWEIARGNHQGDSSDRYVRTEYGWQYGRQRGVPVVRLPELSQIRNGQWFVTELPGGEH